MLGLTDRVGQDDSDCNACERLDVIENEITNINETINVLQIQINEIGGFQDEFFNSASYEHVTQITVGNVALKAGSLVVLTPSTTAGEFLVPVRIVMLLKVVSNVFTNAPPVDIFWATPGSASQLQTLNTDSSFWQSATDSIHMTDLSGNQNGTQSTFGATGNQLCWKPQAGLTGNAGNDNYVIVYLWYNKVDLS